MRSLRSDSLFLVALCLPLAGIGCGPEPLPEIPDPPGPAVKEVTLEEVGLSAAAMDTSADPCVDFYQYACGNWEKTTKIPSDKPRWSRSFSEIHKRNIEDLKTLLEGAQQAPGGDMMLTKLGDFYAGCMDESAIEAAGLTGVKRLWDTGAAAQAKVADDPPEDTKPEGADAKKGSKPKKGRKSKKGDAGKASEKKEPPKPPVARVPLERAIAELHGHGVYVFFDIDSGQDFKDATKMIAAIDQNGLGLPDRDYYLSEEADKKEARVFYQQHVARMLVMAGYDEDAAAVAAASVMRIETELATLAKSRVERRDPKGMYNKIDRGGLREKTTGFAWDAYFAERRLNHVNDVTVTSVPYIEGLGALLGKLKQTELTHYLQWHVLNSLAQHLPKKFVEQDFQLAAKLSGQATQRPRWKRCIQATDGALGELLAQPYVAKRFSPESKAAVKRMVKEVGEAFRRELGGLPWMGNATRERAADKLDKMAYLIGYPDKWKTYDFPVSRTSHSANVVSAYGFEIRRKLSKIGKPVDRGEWFMTPPTVNAYYSPLKNQMVFPAGILQPPFYNPTANIPVNLGGMGMVVGHELTHGFDDQGSQFDGSGNLNNWWEESTRKLFKERTDCMVKQYDGYEVLPGVTLSGKLTLGENIADAGGVKLAFQAYRAMRENATEVLVANGHSEDKQFFLSVGQTWCSKYRPKFARMRATTDYHSQPNWRVNGSLANTPAFGEVFGCQEGSPMRPKNTCSVW